MKPPEATKPFFIPKKRVLIIGIIIVLLLAAIYFLRPFLFQILNNIYTREKSESIARDWMLKKCPTYVFDGKNLALDENINISSKSCPACYKFTYIFESSHREYGERSGKNLPEALIPHKTVVTVKSGQITQALTDSKYDEINKILNENYAKIKVNLFYPNQMLADRIHDVCSPESLGTVEREIPKTDTIIFDTINLLIKGQLEISEKTTGFYTEFTRPNFKFIGADLDKGALILQFTEIPGFTNGGACRNKIMRAQLEKTALQFPQVQSIKITPETIFEY